MSQPISVQDTYSFEVTNISNKLHLNHSRQQINPPDICLTFAVMDGERRHKGRRLPIETRESYSRLRSLCPAWLPLYLLFVALNRQDTLNPIRRESR